MTTFQAIVLIMFCSSLVAQWVQAIHRDCPGLSFLFGFEIVAFGYLARTLM